MHDLLLPQGQVTGIGSLPHTNPVEAVRFVAEHSPAIPFWPQLPQRDPAEIVIAQMLAPLLDLLDAHTPARFSVKRGKLAEFRRRLQHAPAMLYEDSAAGFFAFERSLAAGDFPAAVAVKGQLAGSVTLAHCVFVDDQPLAASPELVIDLTDYLCRLALWQLDRLRRFGKSVILFIDEAALELGATYPTTIDGLRRLISTLQTADCLVGVHCCASTAPTALCAMQPDIISFDAYQGLEIFLQHEESLAFVERDGWLAFGMVPTLNQVGHFNASDAFLRWLMAAEKYDLHRLAAQTMITATCGLGLLDLAESQAIFGKCRELSTLITETLHVTQRDLSA